MLAWPSVALAQQPDSRKRIGVLIARPENDAEGQSYVAAFQQAIEQLGWRPGQNMDIEYGFSAGDPGLAQALAKELVAFRPNILVINSTASVIAAREAAGAIPIVMVAVADPVAQGFVQSLERPGNNVTGFAVEEPEMGAKWIELLKEIAPTVRHVTAIYNPKSAPFAKMFLPSIERSGASLSIDPAVTRIQDEQDIENAVTASRSQTEGALLFLPDSFLASRREFITEIVGKQRLPAIYSHSSFARSGGLISYGFDRTDIFRRSASYVDRILKGEAPSQLPVQMPTKYELSINLKTAKTLGISVPAVLLARADEVIE